MTNNEFLQLSKEDKQIFFNSLENFIDDVFRSKKYSSIEEEQSSMYSLMDMTRGIKIMQEIAND
jgi:hypothetical protein